MGQAGSYRKLEERLAEILGAYDARSDTNAVRFALSSPRRQWRWEWPPSGACRQYFIASVTKLYVSAIVLQLVDEQRVDLDAPVAR